MSTRPTQSGAGVQDDPGTVELRASLPTLPAGERHILVHDADRRRRVGSAVRLRPLAAQTAHPRCPWVTPPVAVSDPNSFEDGALGPLEFDAERGMERGEQEPRNALRCIGVNDLQDIHIGHQYPPFGMCPRVRIKPNLTPWLHRYNCHRPHGSLNYQPPMSRLRLLRDNLLRYHS